MRRRLFGALAALCIAGGAVSLLPARPADAYMLMCCPWPSNQVPNLVMSEWQQNYTDNSSWFQGAVVNGVNAWNDAPTPVYVSTELYQDNTDISFHTVVASSSDPGPSTGGCGAANSNGQCTWAILNLYEGCYNGCNMQQGTPNYDQQTVAHELGHALGLDHSCTADVLMSGPNPSCSNGGASYACVSDSNCISTPQQDDINGVVSMYGRDSYQYGSGGCASTAPLPVPSPPMAPASTMTPPPVPTLPPTPDLPWNVVDGTEQTVTGDAANPGGAADNAVNDALAATGKVVPWSSLPVPSSVPAPPGVQRPC